MIRSAGLPRSLGGRACSILLLGAAAIAGCGPRRAPDLELLAPEKIEADTTFARRTILIDQPSDDGALVIETDGVVLDLSGGDLVGAEDGTPPDRFAGRGIVVRGAKDVTVRNANIRGFKVGVYAEDSPGLRVENCDVSNNYRQHLKSTPQREHLDDWLWGQENDENEWLRYGAGIYLLRCDEAVVLGNRARNGQNGICLDRTNKALVVNNDMSFMSGWGLAMWRSSFCQVLHNRFDFCVRGYSHGVYERGQDSTGILVYEQCSDNLFAYNSATHGGDGFFLYAGNETVKETGEGGCNRNVVYMNDFSYAVANGIEATFSDQNVFVSNKLNHCRHGVWAGYSTRSLIARNEITHCDSGVSIEHGQGNLVEQNVFRDDRLGVHYWWDDDQDLLRSAFGKKQGGQSKQEWIRWNWFVGCETAILLRDTTEVLAEANLFRRCGRVLSATGQTQFAGFDENDLQGGVVENKTDAVLVGSRNYVSGTTEVAGKVVWKEPVVDLMEFRKRAPVSICGVPGEPARRWPGVERSVIKFVLHLEALSGSMLQPLSGVPQGKENILVDEWGPYDFVSAKVHPQHAVGWESVTVQILGPGTAFEASVHRGDVTVSPLAGVTPALLTIARRSAEPGVSVYAVSIKMGDAPLETSGVVMSADWDIAYYQWAEDTDPRSGNQAWRKITSTEPIHQQRTGSLDFVWGGRGIRPGLPADHFALIATANMGRFSGDWTFKTISDDGVRVYLDGQRIIDDWTWHVPTEDVVTLRVEDGEHEVRIEYFEITGHAQLQFFMEPGGR
jgi:parallel beta-helix repeat protein